MFEEALKKALVKNQEAYNVSNVRVHYLIPSLKEVLDWPDSPRRTRILHRFERHALNVVNEHNHKIGADEVTLSTIDWSTIDWSAVLMIIVKILIALLPLIL